ncbi:hypothetical protein BS50DRAFT_567874 [Corynespora cassiicola Philippines]|uniref:Glycoside hydrolase n=1 Tax=Corynespora cassiicola Philippines TaxID=1448308 RepID=A0A2T2PCR1_CORCC|nr:hypothetical protein BS50DRAFT_567874 [Corynespora cassiicola Philippines]
MVNIKILVLSTISIFASTGSAADCYGKNPKASIDAAWAARQAYCGNNLWKNTATFALNGVQIVNTSPGSNTQQVCWDAFENIINQCRKNGFNLGLYEYGDAEYNMSWGG